MHPNSRTTQKHYQSEALRDWDYQAAPPPQGQETPPLKDELTVLDGPAPEAIRTLAYYKWLAAGQPLGDGVQFWLAAERELLEKKG